MKVNKLQLHKPCTENWELMTPGQQGRFCAHCSKQVIDFTSMNPLQIHKIIQESNNEVCGRLTEDQLAFPIFHFEQATEHYKFPFRKVAAGIALAASLSLPYEAHSQSVEETPVELVSHTQNPKIEETAISQHNSDPSQQTKSSNKEIFEIKGLVLSEQDSLPMAAVKVILSTKEEVYIAYADDQGKFTLSVTTLNLRYENVITVSYGSLQEENLKVAQGHFKATDHILTKDQLTSGEEIVIYSGDKLCKEPTKTSIRMGGVSSISEANEPIYLVDGKIISGNTMKKLDVETISEIMVYKDNEAKAILGEEAPGGLIIITTK